MNSVHKKNLKKIYDELDKKITPPKRDTIKEDIVKSIYKNTEKIYKKRVNKKNTGIKKPVEKIDDILTSRCFGYPAMLILLGFILWITIIGANYPSRILADGLFWIEGKLTELFMMVNSPLWLQGILIQGIYRTLAWVTAVMLPPMAIFFPLFTLLEDLGYLPRVAFNLDNFFKKAGSHGKQALTMCMGFGCNAAGVIACRIIESPREKLIAILTNNFVPCNGRFPTLIILSSLFMNGMVNSGLGSLLAACIVVGMILLGIIITLLISRLLSSTILKGVPSSFTLELPPYRKPQIGKVLLRSFLDRTLFVLGKAVMVAAPAGAIVWIFANLSVSNISLMNHTANFMDPFARLIGLDGIILLAFILGLPANEIVIPIIIMGYLSAGSMLEPGSTEVLKTILVDNG
ncbi:MAG: nucleoside recognition domain-containing protein, partial [Halanaerobiales bacterium]